MNESPRDRILCLVINLLELKERLQRFFLRRWNRLCVNHINSRMPCRRKALDTLMKAWNTNPVQLACTWIQVQMLFPYIIYHFVCCQIFYGQSPRNAVPDVHLNYKNLKQKESYVRSAGIKWVWRVALLKFISLNSL